MKRLVPIMAMLLLSGCNAEPGENAAAAAPTLRLPAVAGRPGAGYFDIAVSADQGALIAVTSPQAGRVEMHETMQRGTMSSMRPVARLAPDGGRIVFRAGGRHLMLYEVGPRLAPGGTAQFALRFENGQTRTIEATIVAPDGSHAVH